MKRSTTTQLLRFTIMLVLFVTIVIPVKAALPEPQLVKDIYPGSTDSLPFWLTVQGGKLYFAATTAEYGQELWVSNGLPDGTRMVKDINQKDSTSFFNLRMVTMGELQYYAASDGVNGVELWQTDSTAAGTKMVKDINPGSDGSFPQELTVVNNKLYFLAYEPQHGKELWVYDPASNTASMAKEFIPGASGLSWDDPYHQSYDTKLFALGSNILLNVYSNDPATEGLWFYNTSTNAATRIDSSITRIDLGFTTDSKVLYFSGENNQVNEYRLYKTDGTQAGTQAVMQKNALFVKDSGQMVLLNQTIYFLSASTSQLMNLQLMKLAPGAAVAELVYSVANAYGQPDGSSQDLYVANGKLLFTISTGFGEYQYWRSDGTTANTARLCSSCTYTIAEHGAVVSDRLYFTATDAEHGNEIWSTDGTDAGTTLFADLAPGPGSINPTSLTALGEKLVFVAGDADHGRELWSTYISYNNHLYLPLTAR